MPKAIASMTTTYFSLFGFITLALTLCGGFVFYFNLPTRQEGGHNLSFLIVIIVLGTPLGIGLLLHRKWAAISFSVPLLLTGIWLIVGSLLTVAWPWAIINISLGIVLILPTVITYRRWALLT